MSTGTVSRFFLLLLFTALPLISRAQFARQGSGLARRASAATAVAFKRNAMRVPAAPQPDCDPHPGTVAACPVTLQQAVDDGSVDLSSKGLISGDEVAITIDNTQSPAKCPVVKIQLFIEFYGPGATDANVQLIKDAIETVWNGRTSSDGRKIEVEVVPRISSADSPPGSKGFHEVRLVDTETRDVVNGMGSNFDINRGTGSAEWTTGAEDNIYAHEAGHFMMFPDYYDDYDKLPNGTWQNQTNNQIVTSAQLADWLIRNYPDKSLAERQQILDNTPVGKGISLTQAGHEGDLMANSVTGSIKQYSIDALAAHSDGIVVTVDPGDVMLSKDPTRQSVVITHLENIFVPSGQIKTCGGLYGSCIDGNKLWTDAGTKFDLAPPLGEWPPNSAAALLAQLARYIDANKLYNGSLGSQEAIWRLTDNEDTYLAGGGDVLWRAGIHVRDTLYDFPHSIDPDSSRSRTGFALPPQIVLPRMTPAAMLVQPGTQVQWSGKILRPASAEQSYRFSWSLGKPDSSSASLADPLSDALRFRADKRGVYMPRAMISRQGAAAYASSPGGVLVAADAMTETFESGSLRSGAPFFWGNGPVEPWSVSDSASFSGRFALRSVNTHLFFDSTSDLGVKIDLPTDGDLSFAFRAGSGALYLSIDSRVEVLFGFTKPETGWQYVSFHLDAGTHDLVWSYSGCTPGDSTGAMTAAGAWLDDIFFPPNASLIRTPVERNPAPVAYSLSQNFPNPFSGGTAIRFALPAAQSVRLVLYDILGHEVRSLLDETRPAGEQSVTFNSAGLAPGVYFYRLTAGTFSAMKSLVVLN